jgi:serine protease
MKRTALVFAAVAVVASLGEAPRARASEAVRVAARAAAPAAPLPAYREGEVIVEFRAGTRELDVERAVRAARGVRARSHGGAPRYLVSLEAGAPVAEAVRRLQALPEVAYAEPNTMARAFQREGHFAPNDRLYGLQWHLRMVDSERTWGIQRGDASVVVAVLDIGIAYEDFGVFRKAPDFGTTRFVAGFDFVNGDTHANDDNFHGTHVASVIAESTDNAEGVAGLAFGTAIMPVKVLDEEGTGSFFDIAAGVDFAVSNGAKVINLSLGTDTCTGSNTTMANAVNRAVAAGVTVVAAAGNEGDVNPCVKFPARLPNVIAVGAVDGRKARAPYSDFGNELDLVAPGGDLDRDDTGTDGRPDGRPDGILQQTFDPDTAFFDGRYDDFAYFFVVGTSQAAPHVSALASLLYRQGITDPVAIQRAIELTAEDLGAAGRDDQFGHGLIRPSVALSGLGLNQQP